MCESHRDRVSFQQVCIVNYCNVKLFDACFVRARAIRYGIQKAQSPAERVWAKRLTFAEAYNMDRSTILLQASSKPMKGL